MLHRNYAKHASFATALGKNADISALRAIDCAKTYRAMLHLGVVYRQNRAKPAGRQDYL
ncbi:MAG: hypothetical protein ACJAZ1_000621 [Yoonia sp.]|jgi:hypothetical protein